MPIHDWRRVDPGVFHHFHSAWITEISGSLNGGLLPPDYYALSEQFAGETGPDILTLQSPGPTSNGAPGESDGNTGVLAAPPRVRQRASGEADWYARKHRTLAIHHRSDHRVVAILEILSPGNKAGRRDFKAFLRKATSALAQRIHLLLIDLFPPTRRCPRGIHDAIWSDLIGEEYHALPDCPLTLVAYEAGVPIEAYIEPVHVGQELPEMPLFLRRGLHVLVPLEETYQRAYRGVPAYWRAVIEGANVQ